SAHEVEVILERERAYLPVMDRIVFMFEAEAGRQVTRLRTLGIGATLAVLGLLLGLSGLVLKPATQLIRDQVYRLSASEERFRLLIERMHDGLAVFTADGNLRYVNSRFAEILQRDRGELPGRPLQDFVSGPNLLQLLRMLSDVPGADASREISWDLPGKGSC